MCSAINYWHKYDLLVHLYNGNMGTASEVSGILRLGGSLVELWNFHQLVKYLHMHLLCHFHRQSAEKIHLKITVK